jgi:antitoxin (DNA-binding transcriptional repressor) of toxin-antitoxin stability system
MKLKAITVTEAARNFAHCVNQVRYQNAGFVLMKNGRRFARLVPDGEKTCTGSDLAEALGRAGLTPAESRTWRNDLSAARKSPKPPGDKWR